MLKINRLSKQKYIERTDWFCDQSWARMLDGFEHDYRRVARAYQNGQDSRAKGRRFEDATKGIFLAGMQAQFDDVQYLGAPAGSKPEVETLLRAMQQAIYDGWKMRIRSAKQFMNLFGDFNLLAYEYGVNHCLVYESNFRETAKDREEA